VSWPTEPCAFYGQIPSYRKAIELSGASRGADLVEIGDEKVVAAAVRRYFDAGATEVVFTQTSLIGERDRERTWRLLGELAGVQKA